MVDPGKESPARPPTVNPSMLPLLLATTPPPPPRPPMPSFFPLPVTPHHPLAQLPAFDATLPRRADDSPCRSLGSSGFFSARSHRTESPASRASSPPCRTGASARGANTGAPPPPLIAGPLDSVNSFLCRVIRAERAGRRAVPTTATAPTTSSRRESRGLVPWLLALERAARRRVDRSEAQCRSSVGCHWALSWRGPPQPQAVLDADETMPFVDAHGGWGRADDSCLSDGDGCLDDSSEAGAANGISASPLIDGEPCRDSSVVTMSDASSIDEGSEWRQCCRCEDSSPSPHRPRMRL